MGSFGPRATPCLLVSVDLRRCCDVVLPRAGWGGFDEPSIPDFSMIRHPAGHPAAETIVCVIPVNAPQLRTHNSWSGFAFGHVPGIANGNYWGTSRVYREGMAPGMAASRPQAESFGPSPTPKEAREWRTVLARVCRCPGGLEPVRAPKRPARIAAAQP